MELWILSNDITVDNLLTPFTLENNASIYIQNNIIDHNAIDLATGTLGTTVFSNNTNTVRTGSTTVAGGVVVSAPTSI